MDALNLLRAVLVGFALIATMLLATRGQWIPVTVLSVGIAAHLALFVHQQAARRRQRARALRIDGRGVSA
ncbi:MAG: hypothetical protein WD358_08690 [Nitriliruptoraceae bacterium]